MPKKKQQHLVNMRVFSLFICLGTSCFPMDHSGDRRGDKIRTGHTTEKTEKKSQEQSDHNDSNDSKEEKKSSETPRASRDTHGDCSCGPQRQDGIVFPNGPFLLDSRHILGASEIEVRENSYFFEVADLVVRADWKRLGRIAECGHISAELGAALLAFAIIAPVNRVEAVRSVLGLRHPAHGFRFVTEPLVGPDAVYPDDRGLRSVIFMIIERGDLTLLDVFLDEGFPIAQPLVGAPIVGDTLLHVIVRDGLEVVLVDMLERATENPARIDGIVRALTVTNGRRETPMGLALGARNKTILNHIEKFLAKVRPLARPDHVPAAMTVTQHSLPRLAATRPSVARATCATLIRRS